MVRSNLGFVDGGEFISFPGLIGHSPRIPAVAAAIEDMEPADGIDGNVVDMNEFTRVEGSQHRVRSTEVADTIPITIVFLPVVFVSKDYVHRACPRLPSQSYPKMLLQRDRSTRERMLIWVRGGCRRRARRFRPPAISF